MAGEHLVVHAGAEVPAAAGAATIDIREAAEVPRAVAAAVAGHRVVAVVHEPAGGGTTADGLFDLVTAELRRVGPGVGHDLSAWGDDSGLSEESLEILRMLATGLTVGQAATRLNISPRTATRRVEQARRSLGVDTTAEAVAVLLQRQSPATATTDLVGRAAARSRIRELLGSDGAVLIVGEGAVGKSALLSAVEADLGRPAHRGGGQQTLGWVDFWVVARAAGLTDRSGDVEGVAARVERAIGPDLLVIDDAHLADPSSLAVLAALVGRVAMLVACRPDETVTGPLVAAGFRVESLAPLAAREVATLARRLNPDVTAGELDRIVAGSGGLPLLVEFLSRSDAADLRGRGLVPVVETLSDGARATALRLALADRPLPADEHAQELVASGIAAEEEDGVRVRHALIAAAIREAAAPDEVCSVLRDLGEEALDRGDLAAAAVYASAGGDDARGAQLAVAAAERTPVAGERAHLLASASRLAPTDQALRLQALEALSLAGRHRDVLDLAAALAVDTTPDADRRARVGLVVARAQWHLGDAEVALVAARDGLAAVKGTGGETEAALIRELVRCDVLSSGAATPEHDALMRRAGDLAIAGGFPRAAQLSVEGIVAHFTPGQAGRAAELFVEGRELARAEGDLDTFLRCTNNVISTTVEFGDVGQAGEMAREMAALAADAGLGEWQAQALAMSANLNYHRADFAAALADLEQLDSLAVDERTRLQAAEARAAVFIELGLLDEARSCLPDLSGTHTDDWLSMSATVYLTAEHAYWSGQPRQALDILEPLRALPMEVADRWFGELTAAWSCYDLGLPIEVTDAVPGTPLRVGLSQQARAVAVLAVDPVAAVTAMDEAAEAARPWTYAISLVAEWGAAEAARLAGRDDAIDRLLAVEKHATEAGLEPLLTKVRRSLRLDGVRRSAARGLDRSGLVTTRERMVIDLLAQGATYEEVARRLGVGRSTVRRLLANAQAKLGSAGKFATVAAVRS